MCRAFLCGVDHQSGYGFERDPMAWTTQIRRTRAFGSELRESANLSRKRILAVFVWTMGLPLYQDHKERSNSAAVRARHLPETTSLYQIVIVELEVPEDHIHMVVLSEPIMSQSKVLQIVKSISAREFFHHYVKAGLMVYQAIQQEINVLEQSAYQAVRLTPDFMVLQIITGIGEILGLTIVLETGDIHRFAAVLMPHAPVMVRPKVRVMPRRAISIFSGRTLKRSTLPPMPMTMT